MADDMNEIDRVAITEQAPPSASFLRRTLDRVLRRKFETVPDSQINPEVDKLLSNPDAGIKGHQRWNPEGELSLAQKLLSISFAALVAAGCAAPGAQARFDVPPAPTPEATIPTKNELLTPTAAVNNNNQEQQAPATATVGEQGNNQQESENKPNYLPNIDIYHGATTGAININDESALRKALWALDAISRGETDQTAIDQFIIDNLKPDNPLTMPTAFLTGGSAEGDKTVQYIRLADTDSLGERGKVSFSKDDGLEFLLPIDQIQNSDQAADYMAKTMAGMIKDPNLSSVAETELTRILKPANEQGGFTVEVTSPEARWHVGYEVNEIKNQPGDFAIITTQEVQEAWKEQGSGISKIVLNESLPNGVDSEQNIREAIILAHAYALNHYHSETSVEEFANRIKQGEKFTYPVNRVMNAEGKDPQTRNIDTSKPVYFITLTTPGLSVSRVPGSSWNYVLREDGALQIEGYMAGQGDSKFYKGVTNKISGIVTITVGAPLVYLSHLEDQNMTEGGWLKNDPGDIENSKLVVPYKNGQDWRYVLAIE